MDAFASALANVWTIVPEKDKILTYGEGSFVSGHYDLIVDRLSMKVKGPIKETLPEVLIIDDKRHDKNKKLKKIRLFKIKILMKVQSWK